MRLLVQLSRLLSSDKLCDPGATYSLADLFCFSNVCWFCFYTKKTKNGPKFYGSVTPIDIKTK